MNRRGWLFGLAATLTAGGFLMAAEQRTAAGAASEDACVKACNDCRASCLACVDHCLGKKGEEDCVRACLDCADICGTCATVGARNGPMSAVIARACAEACEKCAATCGEDADDAQKACAEKCRACVAACMAEARG